MDTSRYKDVLAKLSFLTSYSSLLVPVIITVVALMLLILSIFMGDKLTKEITETSVSTGKNIQSLSKNSPSSEQWKLVQQYQQDYATDANQLALLAKQSTQRQLLSYGIFPEPKDTSALIFERFGQEYRSELEQLLVRVNALDCPSDIELDRSIRGSTAQSSRSSTYAPAFSGSFSTGSAFGRSSGTGTVAEKITNVLCREKAESASVYCNVHDLAGYDYWNEYKYTSIKEDTDNCWRWQLAYWIIKDVIDSAGSVNANSDSVYTSSVKRLLSVSFGEKVSRYTASGTQKRCEYVLPTTATLKESCTQRVSNNDIDVVHFSVEAIVDVKAVLRFMKELCSVKQHKFKGYFGQANEQIFKHNQITILKYDMVPVDRQDSAHRLYRYGQDAVVKLNLACEYIFDKSGYDAIKPESVKESKQGLTGRSIRGR